MGMVLSFTRVTPEALAKGLKDPEWTYEHLHEVEPTDDLDGYLDKAWAGIQFLLDEEEAEIDLRMGGVPIGNEGALAGWSVDEVRYAARRLGELPFEQLARHYDPEKLSAQDVYPNIWLRDDDALDYLQYHYEVLVRFFAAAAASGSAAIMSFSY